ncbi:hypothetical protein FSW04_10715 [Baekduia soli]|uniref:Uncharacterized protein n=1 Tax=Baekduia soli TaxID=496014 RepID=A0A5B8U4K6_9ACTN|nr:hypothetical protein [Baekduia soli]QEC47993.1 hypothetical protein FSW04_10715 [Baekduia soli]
MTVACGRYAAAFALDDPDVLVDAALCCPLCLGADTRIDVRHTNLTPNGRGTCPACDATWSVTLDPQQLLRLALDPPAATRVTFSGRLPLLPPHPEDDE